MEGRSWCTNLICMASSSLSSAFSSAQLCFAVWSELIPGTHSTCPTLSSAAVQPLHSLPVVISLLILQPPSLGVPVNLNRYNFFFLKFANESFEWGVVVALFKGRKAIKGRHKTKKVVISGWHSNLVVVRRICQHQMGISTR